MSMQNITLFKVPLWKNDYHRFCIQSKFTGWYRSGLWHELGTIEILVIAGQISVQAGDVTLLSWRKRCEDITELGWLTLCSPPLAENSWILADCPYWDCGCELFKDINNWGILASCWQSFFASLTRNSSNLRSLSAFSFNWHLNLLPCAAIEPFIPRAIAGKPCVVDLIFSNSLCGGLTIFDFFRNGGLSVCLTFWWIPLGASSSAYLSSASRSFKSVPSDLLELAGSLSSSSSLPCSSREESEKFSLTNKVSAALDSKFNGLCVSGKTGFKIWYQWGFFSGSSPEPFFAWCVLFVHSVLNHLYFCHSFSIDMSNFVRVLLK